jgi:predicted neuraminidase
MGSVESSPEVQAIQPSLLRHSQTRLQALGRTRDSGIFQTWSEDNGRTWGPLTTTGLPNPSSGTDAVTLADGRHVLVYNHNTHDRGRSPLNVAVSDDGRAWRAALVLEDDPDAPDGFAYPAVIQTSDGLVHVSYTWQRKRVRHVVLDPTHLDGPPIVDGFWPVGPADQP